MLMSNRHWFARGAKEVVGYYPNAKKCWLVTKSEKENEARQGFGDTTTNISTQGQKHLGAVLGSRTHLEGYVKGKVEN